MCIALIRGLWNIRNHSHFYLLSLANQTSSVCNCVCRFTSARLLIQTVIIWQVKSREFIFNGCRTTIRFPSLHLQHSATGVVWSSMLPVTFTNPSRPTSWPSTWLRCYDVPGLRNATSLRRSRAVSRRSWQTDRQTENLPTISVTPHHNRELLPSSKSLSKQRLLQNGN